MITTDENERCERSELLKNQCAHCKEVKERDEGDKEIVYWDAKYETVCRWPTCQLVIDVGERVKWSPDGGSVVHAKHRTRP